MGVVVQGTVVVWKGTYRHCLKMVEDRLNRAKVKGSGEKVRVGHAEHGGHGGHGGHGQAVTVDL